MPRRNEKRWSLRRYIPFGLCLAATVAIALYTPRPTWLWIVLVVAGALTLLGLYDLVQRSHSVRRNYPVTGNFRWLFESIRPEIRQYLIEGDNDEAPFSRSQRSLVYARAKNEGSERAFGTLRDVYGNGYEFIAHSTRPAPPSDPGTFRIPIGNDQCERPYSASIFNISAMSFGSLSANAILALNKGARFGGFAHDTGEGSISRYHQEHGGDLIWEIGSGYFGCRTADGNFDPDRFGEKSSSEQVRMIEIKLSQGAKPGHGGILPAAKVTREISLARGVPMGEDCLSPARHRAFSTPIEMMEFVARLRKLSGGKPVGFKLCLGHPWEFMGIVKAMRETGIVPDFIVVDGAEGGTGASPLEFSDHIGVPLREGLLFAHNTLVGAGLRNRIKIGAAGKIVSAFDIAAVMALGADWTNAGRGFMFAVGCIQSLTCNTNRCPTGVATQDPTRQRALVVDDKAQRVCNFHRNTLAALSEMIAAAGLEHPSQIRPHHLVRRVGDAEIRLFSQLHVFLEPGALIEGCREHEFYTQAWNLARADSFELPSAQAYQCLSDLKFKSSALEPG
ncbi:MAG TPA: FMN-binding glutamate synthase family protein [Allosphingosinicella sp.]|nr:FMN-binding glutamate synthase family protein [Allosphingosinicella sp.]